MGSLEKVEGYWLETAWKAVILHGKYLQFARDWDGGPLPVFQSERLEWSSDHFRPLGLTIPVLVL